MSPSVDVLSAQLQALASGQRAWFFFCPGVEGADPLQLAPFGSDPLGAALRERLRDAAVPAEVLPVFGMCVVDEDGIISFAAPEMTDLELTWMADWARSVVGVRPGLNRLYGARAVTVRHDFTVVYTFEVPELWSGLVPVTPPGSLESTLASLEAMVPGDQAWFWATTCGPAGRPLLLVEPCLGDATVADLNRRVEGAIRRSPSLGRTLRGVIHCDRSGAFSVRTRAEPGLQERVLRRLGRDEKRLRWMVRPPAPPPPDDLVMAATTLERLTPGEDASFVVVLDEEGQPAVHIAPVREPLRPILEAARTANLPHTYGRLRLEDGHIELYPAQALRNLLPILARWVAGRARRYPALTPLAHARLRLPDEDAPQQLTRV